MIDRIVVVDSGQVIETTESAIIAKDEADRAEKWAKYSEEQANLASDNAIAAAASKEAAAQSAQSAANTVNGFDAHAAEKQQDFDDNAESKTNTYNSNASTLLQQYTDNAAQKLSAYNSNDATKTQAFNDNYTSKLNSFNSNASKKQAQVDASAETARKWAIGTISEQPQGSAKYWAEQAKTVTDGTLNESILTNCLTEIPQDIKVELSNGTLTLKAGSKVYVPNGVGKFDVVTIQKDVGGKRTSTGQEFLLSDKNGDIAFWRKLYSGDSKPVDSGSYVWYDTANNVIKATTDGGASWLSEKFSLPLGIYTANGTNITSIDQVFNGFGYIGNTIFALPGIKGRVPNGFSTDGKPNSTEFTTTNVLTVNNTGVQNNSYIGFFGKNAIIVRNYRNAVYDEYSNVWNNPEAGFDFQYCLFGTFSADSTGRITSLTPNTAFHAVDYSEYSREIDRCAKVDEDNNFTGNCTFLNSRALFKADARSAEGGEFAIAIPNSQKEVLGDVWSFDVFRNGDVRIFRVGGSQSMTLFTFSATSGVLNYIDGRTLSLSDNSGNVPDTKWVNSKFQKVSTLPAQPDPNVTYLIPEE